MLMGLIEEEKKRKGTWKHVVWWSGGRGGGGWDGMGWDGMGWDGMAVRSLYLCVCRFLSREGVTWGWVRDPQMHPSKKPLQIKGKNLVGACALLSQLRPVVYGSFKSESDPRSSFFLSFTSHVPPLSLSFSFGRTSVSIHPATDYNQSGTQTTLVLPPPMGLTIHCIYFNLSFSYSHHFSYITLLISFYTIIIFK